MMRTLCVAAFLLVCAGCDESKPRVVVAVSRPAVVPRIPTAADSARDCAGEALTSGATWGVVGYLVGVHPTVAGGVGSALAYSGCQAAKRP